MSDLFLLEGGSQGRCFVENLWWPVRHDSLEDFKKLYKPGMAKDWIENGRTLLHLALGNLEHRAEICNFLLDEGADASVVALPDRLNCLHILLGYAPSKMVSAERNAADCALLGRLLDGGADINGVARKIGTPIQYFTEGMMKLPSEELAVPFYEVLFSRPDLDLMKVGAFKETVYRSIWVSSFRSTIMLGYAQRYLRERGLEVPDLGEPPQPRRSGGVGV